MESTAKQIRAYALVQTLEQTFRDLMTLWSDAGDELDDMLQPNYPFNYSMDDMWAETQKWMDGMTAHPIIPPKAETVNEGKIYLFVDGLYHGEFDGSDEAALRACEIKGIDPTEMKDSGEGWADYICNEIDAEIIHESDYRFYQGNNHPANRMELKEFYNEFEDAEFSWDGNQWFKGKHRPSINWNGFACPYFDYDTAKAILATCEDSKVHYDADRDMWVHEYMDDPPFEYEGILFDGVKMYAIGAWNWTWSARPIEPRKKITVYDLTNGRMLLKCAISNFEIHPCKEIDGHVEQCDDEPNPDFYSVYIRYHQNASNGHCGGIDCIADCDTWEEATNFVNLLMAMFKGMFMMQTES